MRERFRQLKEYAPRIVAAAVLGASSIASAADCANNGNQEMSKSPKYSLIAAKNHPNNVTQRYITDVTLPDGKHVGFASPQEPTEAIDNETKNVELFIQNSQCGVENLDDFQMLCEGETYKGSRITEFINFVCTDTEPNLPPVTDNPKPVCNPDSSPKIVGTPRG